MTFKRFGIFINTGPTARTLQIGKGAWFFFYYQNASGTSFVLRTPFAKYHLKNGMAYFSERHGYVKPIIKIGKWRLFKV